MPEREDWIRKLADRLSSRLPAPAGGAAAGLSLVQGAALGVKVLRISGRSETAEALGLARVLARAIPQFEEDCRAVRVLLSKGSSPEDLENALAVSFESLSLARDGLEELARAVDAVKPVLICDAGASGSLMWSAAEIAHWNLMQNAQWLADRCDTSRFPGPALEARSSARTAYETVLAAVRGALSRRP